MTGSKSETRVVYITRHGESEYNRAGKIGGDGDLSYNGNLFAMELAKFVETTGIYENLTVWTSTYKRTKQTAKYIRCVAIESRSDLDELNCGVCDGLTYEEIAACYPQEFALRDQDKYRYKYPKGESYEDVSKRLANVYDEFKRRDHLLIVCHQAVVRCLLARLLNKSLVDLPYIDVPLHTIFKCSFNRDELCDITHIQLPIPAIDTYRLRPQNVSESRSLEDALSTIPQHDSDSEM